MSCPETDKYCYCFVYLMARAVRWGVGSSTQVRATLLGLTPRIPAGLDPNDS